MTLGQKIKAARLDRGMTQKELVGDAITRNMLSKIENDSATPSVRTLEYLAQALDLPTGYFLAGAPLSIGSIPDGLDGPRDAYRRGDWLGCLDQLNADQKASTSDEGYLLHAHAGAYAAKSALEQGDYATARELAETAQYYNQEGMYYSSALSMELSLTLGHALVHLGEAHYAEMRRDVLHALDALVPPT